MSKWSIFALCIIAAVGLWFYNNGACPLQAMGPSSDTASSGSYQQITASQVKERLDKGDKTPRLWPEKGVGMKVELRYGAFDQDMNTKHGYVNFRDVMAGSYGDTYWFYLIFKK